MDKTAKYKRCSNCLHEGDQNAAKCDKGVPRDQPNGCMFHDFRPGWELQGTLFEEFGKC